MGLGAFGGGVLFDQLGTYWSLHVASTVVGAGAVAVAFALRPPTYAPAPAPGYSTGPGPRTSRAQGIGEVAPPIDRSGARVL